MVSQPANHTLFSRFIAATDMLSKKVIKNVFICHKCVNSDDADVITIIDNTKPTC